MFSKLWRLLKGAAGIYGFLSSEFAKVWLLPVINTTGYIVLNYIQHQVPLAYLWVGACLVFASTAGGLLWLDTLRARKRVEGKLVFVQPRFVCALLNQTEGVPKIGSAQVGIDLNSKANFPISFVVDELDTNILKRSEPNKKWQNNGVVMSPEGNTTFWDMAINFNGEIDVQTLPVFIKFRLRYGTEGNEKYKIQEQITTNMIWDEKAKTYVMSHWTYDSVKTRKLS